MKKTLRTLLVTALAGAGLWLSAPVASADVEACADITGGAIEYEGTTYIQLVATQLDPLEQETPLDESSGNIVADVLLGDDACDDVDYVLTLTSGLLGDDVRTFEADDTDGDDQVIWDIALDPHQGRCLDAHVETIRDGAVLDDGDAEICVNNPAGGRSWN